jgi:uncharacterized membrane protein YeiH
VLELVAAAAPDTVYEAPVWISIAATAVGAIEGSLLALDEPDADVIGMAVLAACLGFGGGIVRDLLCGTLPPAALQDPAYLVTVILCTVGVWLAHHLIRRLGSLLYVLDALVLGLFGVVGAQQALLVGLPTVSAILLGAIVSVSGGILADLLSQRRPAIMQAGPPYATASLIGVIWYVVAARELGVDANVAAAIAVGIVVVLRVLADRLGVTTPRADAVTGATLQRLRAAVADRVAIRRPHDHPSTD